jgi:hypothetical protein
MECPPRRIIPGDGHAPAAGTTTLSGDRSRISAFAANSGTARALGLAVPPPLRGRFDGGRSAKEAGRSSSSASSQFRSMLYLILELCRVQGREAFGPALSASAAFTCL